jgi:uroporphyrinogen-III decarboxylase
MIQESMTAKERIEAAIQLKKVDRLPITVGVSSPFIGKYKGLTPAESYRNLDVLIKGDQELWDDLGGWDIRYGSVGLHDKDDAYPFGPTYWAIPRVMPGDGLPDIADVQNLELELMDPSEYDRLIEMGWNDFWHDMITRIYKGFQPNSSKSASFAERRKSIRKYWDDKGIDSVYPSGVMDPVTMLATWRSTSRFMLDIMDRYDKVRTCVHDIIIPEFLDIYRENVKNCGCDIVMVCAATYQMPFVSPQVFEDLQGAWIKGCVDILFELGKTPLFHLDSNWTEAFEWFRQFPKGRCIMHLGGESDIFKAKEILRGRMCLMGDASCTKMQVWTPDRITAYYQKLADVIGEDNGYFMAEGCYLSAYAEPENVRAMVNVAKNYMPR